MHGAQLAAKSEKQQMIIEIVVPVGSAALIVAFVAVAALTGCFGAKAAAAARAAAAAQPGKLAAQGAAKTGAYATGGPIPVSVTASTGR